MASSAGFRRGAAWVPVVVRGVVSIGILAVAIGVSVVLFATRPAATMSGSEPELRQVRVVRAQAFDLPRVWEGYGTARAKDAAHVAAEISGNIVERAAEIEEGAWVSAGDVLVRIDDREAVAEVARIDAEIASLRASIERLTSEEELVQEALVKADEAVALARVEFEALRGVGSRGAASQVEIDRLRRQLTVFERDSILLRERLEQVPFRRTELEAQASAAEAGLRIAQLAVERSVIVAPIAGVIQAVHVDLGDRVAPGTTVAHIIDPRVMEAEVKLAMSAAAEVAVGDRAVFEPASARGGGGVEGRVARILPEAGTSERSITVIVEAEQAVEEGRAPAIVPGSFVIGSVIVESARPRIVVPRKAVQEDRVLVVDADGVVSARVVEVERWEEGELASVDPVEREWAVLASGVEAGMQVVVTNLDELRPGARVSPIDAAAIDRNAAASAGDER